MGGQASNNRPSLSVRAKQVAVDVVKPRVDEAVWDRLVDPLGRDPKRARRRAARREAASRADRVAAMTLDELASEFGTDKWGWHYYTQHYARHFEHLRHREFTMLEIGIGGYQKAGNGGASLRMWQAYFPKAHIIGLDLQDKSFIVEPRVRIYRGSQVDRDVLQRILDDAGTIDVIIDDGSHRPEHIRETFAYLFPRLADDGIYVIEDTQTSYWPTWGGTEDLHSPDSTMALVKDLVDGLNHEEFLDDGYVPTYTDEHVKALHAYHNLVFLEKGANTEGSRSSTKRKALAAAGGAHPFGRPHEQRAGHSVPSEVPGLTSSDGYEPD